MKTNQRIDRIDIRLQSRAGAQDMARRIDLAIAHRAGTGLPAATRARLAERLAQALDGARRR